MRLRLLITEDCNRNCEGCCNKDWDLENLPIATNLNGYEEVLITGGEPMLYPDRVVGIARLITDPDTDIFMYTSKIDVPEDVMYVLRYIDGITVTLHEPEDAKLIVPLDRMIKSWREAPFSLRLNVFKGIEVPKLLCNWQFKPDIEWIPNCPLPEGEVFKRWSSLQRTSTT
jgi:pyruvate formate-lyase activating enzyme-like uncharacterized protein